MSNKKGYVFAGVSLALAALMSVFLFTSANNQKTVDAEKEIKANQIEVSKIQNESKSYTVDKVLANMKDQQIDVTSKINDLNSKIKTNVQNLYKVASEQEYEAVKGDLTRNLGESFANKLIELDKPVVNQSGKAQFPYASADNVQIAYDQYNLKNRNMKVYVTVDYSTPEISTTVTGGSGNEEKSTVRHGQDFFELVFDNKTGNIELENYHEGVNKNE